MKINIPDKIIKEIMTSYVELSIYDLEDEFLLPNKVVNKTINKEKLIQDLLADEDLVVRTLDKLIKHQTIKDNFIDTVYDVSSPEIEKWIKTRVDRKKLYALKKNQEIAATRKEISEFKKKLELAGYTVSK